MIKKLAISALTAIVVLTALPVATASAQSNQSARYNKFLRDLLALPAGESAGGIVNVLALRASSIKPGRATSLYSIALTKYAPGNQDAAQFLGLRLEAQLIRAGFSRARARSVARLLVALYSAEEPRLNPPAPVATPTPLPPAPYSS